jgi:sugar O-acyltransferase (sialic acid O-acetyltransferase NeuD family)
MTENKKELIIIGAGGQARVVIDAAEDAGINVCGIIDVDYNGKNEKILNYSVLGDFSVLNELSPEKTCLAIALGDLQKSADYFHKLQKLGFFLLNIVHPTAIISKYVKIGKGVFINAGAIINAKANVSDNTIINTGAIVDHEVVLGRNCHVCPGVKIGGRVIIGNNTLIGIGSSIVDYVKIGNNVTIGAGSVIINNIESNSTVVGVPGRKIK